MLIPLWHRVDEKARPIILRSLNNLLQQQHMGIANTYVILSRLQEIFSDKGRSATLRSIMNTKMIEGTPIRDHMIRVLHAFTRWRS